MIPRYKFGHDVTIVNLGDIHRGDNACNVKGLRENVQRIKEDDSVFWVSTGDLLNVATKDSKTGPYGSMNVDEEADALKKDLQPILDKCLGVVESNHHKRISRSVGMNLDKWLCREYGMPYLGDCGLINVLCDKVSYYIALHHGVGGGRTMGAKANGIARLEEIYPCCDLYLEGHTHSHMTWPDIQNTIDRKRNRVRQLGTRFSVTGHYIDYEKSYAPSLKLRPKPMGSAAHTLKACGTGNEASKKITVDFWEVK